MTDDVAVFITAYNEERALGDVIERIEPSHAVYVIDDGSTDRTPEIAREHEADVLSHPIRLGQGMATLTAFEYLVTTPHSFYVSMDGDGQHDPAEIPTFLTELRNSSVDVVAGSRLLGSNYDRAPLARRVFLRPLNVVLRTLTGYDVTDFMCGFRAFRATAIREALPLLETMKEPNYMSSEMWIKFASAGLTATDVPVHLRPRSHGSSYKGLALGRYGLGVLRTIVMAQLDRLRTNAPDGRTGRTG